MSQNDFNIANQGFPATRADINSALQALASTSAGATAPSTTYAYQLWYDTSTNLLKMRNADNDGFITLAAFDQAADEWEVRTAVVQAVDSAGVVIKTDDGTTRVTIADSGNVTLANDLLVTGTVQSSNISATGSMASRNKIINGAMTIDQRNAGAAVTPTGSGYLVDRWTASLSQASKLTFQQSTDAPVGFKNSLKVTVASSFTPAAGDFFNVAQVVEGNNVADLEWGTADALTATVSFYAKVSVAGSYAVTVWSGNGDRNYTTDVALTTSWAKYSIVVDGLTSGTVDAGNGAGLRITFDLGSGSDFQTTAGSWQTGSYDINTASSTKFVSQSNGATFYITGVQLEAGSVATPFEYRPYGQELALCQRYFSKSYNTDVAVGAVTQVSAYLYRCVGTSDARTVFLPAAMRATPTVIVFNPTTGGTGTVRNGSRNTNDTATPDSVGAAQWGLFTSGHTAAGDSIRFHWTASAEL